MSYANEFTLGAGGKATITVHPASMASGEGFTPIFEDADLTTLDADLTVEVDENDPRSYIVTAATSVTAPKDVTLSFAATGRVGDSSNPVAEDIICHLTPRDLVGVKFNILIVE